MALVVLARHAHSELNLERRVNGDPTRAVALTDDGRAEARQLGVQLRNVSPERCLTTRFGRTIETARIALAGRDVPLDVEPLLDDIDVGDLEGATIDDYRAWKRAHSRSDAFPGGESLDDAALRYARAFRRLGDAGGTVLVVCHEIPIRYALNAAAGSPDLDRPVHDIPNATPYLFEPDALLHAAAQIEAVSGLPG